MFECHYTYKFRVAAMNNFHDNNCIFKVRVVTHTTAQWPNRMSDKPCSNLLVQKSVHLQKTMLSNYFKDWIAQLIGVLMLLEGLCRFGTKIIS